MVGKIMKHELHALFRKLVILYAIVILFAVLLRIVAAVNVPALDGDTYFGLIVVLVMFYSYSLIAACVAATVLGISRFFKTMFTGEGYLTLALPATPAQLIWAKLLSALIASFSSIIVCLLSACIFYIGLDASIGAVFSDIFATLDAYFATDPLLATELIVLLISVIPMSMLEFYLIASVGQLFTKSRKGMTALLAIGGIFVLSLLSVLVYQPILEACEGVSPHLPIWIMIIVNFAVDVGCFHIVRYILSHKVYLIL